MNNSQSLNFDVIIVGAGLAGSSLACALGRADKNLRIAVIESQLPTKSSDQTEGVGAYDSRVSALTLASQQFLTELAVWPVLQSQRLGAYQRMRVWDGDGTGEVGFAASDVNQPVLGHIVENRLIVTALMAQLNFLANVTLLAPAKVNALLDDKEGRFLTLVDGRILRAPIIVAADGALSPLRQQAGFTTREWDYNHQAIVATVKTELAHDYCAQQCFLTEGPLAFLPLGDALDTHEEQGHYSSIVWSALPERAEQLMALSDADFAKALNRAFESRLGDITAIGIRQCFPLRQRHAIDYVQPGLALVADAAHTIHPLAGQGINLGFNDVRVLAEEILRARKRQIPLHDFSILQRYQRRRKSDNLTMMAAMEAFKRLFAEPSLAVRWLRNTGMHWFNHSNLLKRGIIRRAMGL